MTNVTDLPDLEPNLHVHFYGPLTIPVDRYHSEVVGWGWEMIITPLIRELSRDREGNAWFDLLDDEPAQTARWGEVMFKPGSWPEHLPRIKPGTLDHDEAREVARRTAWNINNDADRLAALAAVKAQYGSAPVTSKTIQTGGDRW